MWVGSKLGFITWGCFRVTVYGYARVSTANQSLLPQQVALRDAGAAVVVTEKVSGTFPERPALDGLVKSLVPGDGLLVVRLDRLGRSLPHLVSLIEDLSERGVSVMSLHEQIDTSSANGRLMVSLFAALAQFESDLISERTKAGLAAARLQGRVPGRPSVMTSERLDAAQRLRADGLSYEKIATALGVSRATVVRHVSGG